MNKFDGFNLEFAYTPELDALASIHAQRLTNHAFRPPTVCKAAELQAAALKYYTVDFRPPPSELDALASIHAQRLTNHAFRPPTVCKAAELQAAALKYYTAELQAAATIGVRCFSFPVK